MQEEKKPRELVKNAELQREMAVMECRLKKFGTLGNFHVAGCIKEGMTQYSKVNRQKPGSTWRNKVLSVVPEVFVEICPIVFEVLFKQINIRR